jgi:hypothetical protein
LFLFTVNMKTTIALLFFFVLFSGTFYSQTQPAQPTSGPGGNNYLHSAVTMHGYQIQQTNGFYIFEPASPTPDSANVVVFIHGLSNVNPYLYGGWINHLVKQGNIVIYPKYQDALGTTPTSAFNSNAVSGILSALNTLESPGHVKPRAENFVVAGHSYGGLMTANMGILAGTSGFPVPKALFSCQGYMDYSYTTRLPDYSIMPSDIKLLIVVGDNDAVVGTTFGHFLMDSTVNTPTAHKNLVTHHADIYGSPAVGSTHLEPFSIANEFNTGETNTFSEVCAAGAKTDAVDYYCYWKLLDALMDCAFYGTNCNYAFGDTPEQRNMGQWSDGQALVPLTVEPTGTSEVPNQEIQKEFIVFPNPSSGDIFIHFSLRKETVIKFKIFNVYGELVYSCNNYFMPGVINDKINAGHLKSGHYTLQIQSDFELITKPIIIN